MKYSQSTLKARPYIFFLASAAVAFVIVLFMETWDVKKQIEETYVTNQGLTRPKMTALEDLQLSRPVANVQPLSTEEMTWATTAWAYFENNTNWETGLVNSADAYPSTTMWDTGSYLMGTVAAEALGVIPFEDAVVRLEVALTALADLPLVDGKLPNKAYHARTLAMVDYKNKYTDDGLGWSAIDIARLVTAMRVVAQHFPGCAVKVNQILGSWSLSEMANDGVMIGSLFGKDGSLVRVQEGRVGYEQYAAKGAMLAGLNVNNAVAIDRFARFTEVQGVLVPDDIRSKEKYQASTHTTSEPYMLSGLEFGYDHEAADLSWRVLSAQEERWKATGHLTAVSETHIKGAPYFVYANVISNGQPWAVFSPSGKRHDDMLTLSTKAAFAWASLFDTDYTQHLRKAAATLQSEKGFYAGRFEQTGEINKALDANTNGVVLEALYYRVYGPMLHAARLKQAYVQSPKPDTIQKEKATPG